jgi:hypothetical protein
MAVNLSPVGGVAAQFFTNNGVPLTGGKIYTYSAGTTTPATTYTTSQGNVQWTNPIVLNAAGRVPSGGEIWLTDGINYKFVLKDANDVTIATYDNISGINSNFVAYTNAQEIQVATAGQTVFNLSTMSYQVGTNSLSVFVDGVNQYGPGAQYAYTETDDNTVTFTNGLHVGAVVKFTTSQQQGAGAVDASQVSYTPPFTGSATTNVEAKLSEYVSVKDFGAVGDGVADDTAAIQAALNSGAKRIEFLAESYKVSALTIPSTVREVVGVGANRAFATRLQFNTGTVTTNAFTVSVGCSGLNVRNLSLEFKSGSYTNGIFISADNHFQTWENVTTDDSDVIGSFNVANHWRVADNCWSNVFIHCGAWGPTVAGTIGFYTGLAANDLDFYSCRWLHCEFGVYIAGGSTEVVNFYGGEIASNTVCGVHIGDTSGSTAGTESINFYGVYFEDQPYNVIQNEANFKGLHFYGCRNSETNLNAHLRLQKITYSIQVIGGAYNCAPATTASLIDVNSQTVVDAFVDGVYLGSGVSRYINAGNQQVWVRTNRIGGSPGQISYETKGIEAQEDFNTSGSYSGKKLKRYLGNNANPAIHDKGFNVVWDGVVPGSGSSIWTTTAFQQGAVCWNSSVTAGGVPGWVCVSAGTPGTWKAMASVAA